MAHPQKSVGKGTLQSDLLQDPHRLTQDAKLISRAVRERWPIPGAKREKIAKRLALIASRPGPRAIQAARTLARMDALNQADEHADRHYQRVDEGKATELVQHEGVEFIVPGLPKTK